MTQDRQLKEHIQTTLSAEIFRTVFKVSFSPTIKEWKRRITQDLEMTDLDRRGLIIAYNEMYRGFLAIYDNSDIEPPEWLYKEFDRDV